ncbi:MAG: hypothetical protein IT233_05930 [Bacteroidia bacterium]|nr:hypothetical protein [Bacteroidia bacterium]
MKTISLFLLIPVWMFSQTNEELYKQGLDHRKNYRVKEGYDIFSRLMKSDSSNSNYLAYGSYFYSKTGIVQKTDEEKIKYYKKAEYLAKKAIALDEKNPEAHYAYAMALGRINENASSSEKIKNSKLIRKEVDRTLELNPKHAGAYHILGRWHRTIAGFSSIEKGMINAFFGGVPPGATYDDAAKAFQNAIVHEPDYILHAYELGVTYKEMKKKEFARAILEKAQKMPLRNEEDKETKAKVDALLKELK